MPIDPTDTIFVLAADRIVAEEFARSLGFHHTQVAHVESADAVRRFGYGHELWIVPGAELRPDYDKIIAAAGLRFRLRKAGDRDS